MKRSERALPLARARILHALDQVGLKAPLKWLVRDVLGLDRPAGSSPRSRGSIISVAPHNLKLYEYFLAFHLAQGRRFITSDTLYGGEPSAQAGDQNLLIRHDVDYTPERLERLTQIEDAFGVHSDIHVIVDPSHYDVLAYGGLLRSLAQRGYCIGLHTLAPNADDFYTVLRREVEAFDRVLGFPPATFSIHGVCPHPANWSEKRARFLAKIAPRLASFGFAGSHNLSGVDFWVEDSGLGGEFAYLQSDWVERTPGPGQVMGVLVHPDHWTDWPIRWQYDAGAVIEAPALERFIRIARGYAPSAPSRGVAAVG